MPRSTLTRRTVESSSALLVLSGLLLFTCTALAASVDMRVAVAANFHHVLQTLKPEFEKKYGYTLNITYGASGTLFELVKESSNNFDLFLSADNIKTAKLVKEGVAVSSSRVSYAQGQLAYWHRQNETVFPLKIQQHIIADNSTPVYIADPDDAPYGQAAKSVLVGYDLYQALKSQNRLIVSDHVSKAWQEVNSTRDSVGFVAASLVIETDKYGNLLNISAGYTIVPQSLYQPLVQELVVLQNSKNMEESQHLINFLLSDNTQAFIRRNGYTTPAETDSSGAIKCTPLFYTLFLVPLVATAIFCL